VNAAVSDPAADSQARHRKVHELNGEIGFQCHRCAGVFRFAITLTKHLNTCKRKKQAAAAASAHAHRSPVSQQQSRPAPTKKAEPAAASATQPQALSQLGGPPPQSEQAQPSVAGIAAVVSAAQSMAQALSAAPFGNPIYVGALFGLLAPARREEVSRQIHAMGHSS
jgi:uncharacterized C2H2 Zn-finger protein